MTQREKKQPLTSACKIPILSSIMASGRASSEPAEQEKSSRASRQAAVYKKIRVDAALARHRRTKKRGATAVEPKAGRGIEQKGQGDPLSLAPLSDSALGDSGSQKVPAAFARSAKTSSLTLVDGGAVVSSSSIGRGVQSSPRTRHVDNAHSETTKGSTMKKRRKPRIPKQYVFLGLLVAGMALTIWQETEYGYVGQSVVEIQQEGIVEFVSNLNLI